MNTTWTCTCGLPYSNAAGYERCMRGHARLRLAGNTVAALEPPPLDPFTYALEGGRIQLIVGEGATREGLAGARRFVDVLLKAQA